MDDKSQTRTDRDQRNKELVLKTLAGDNESFAELVEEYYKLFYSLALSYMHDLDQAKDVVQDGLITIHETLDTLHDPSQFVSWSYTIIRRKAIHALRNMKRETKGMRIYSEIQKMEEMKEKESRSMNLKIRKEAIIKATAVLPERYRQMIVLYYVEEMNIRDIAKGLGVSLVTANVRLFRARRKLKEKLKGTV